MSGTDLQMKRAVLCRCDRKKTNHKRRMMKVGYRNINFKRSICDVLIQKNFR